MVDTPRDQSSTSSGSEIDDPALVVEAYSTDISELSISPEERARREGLRAQLDATLAAQALTPAPTPAAGGAPDDEENEENTPAVATGPSPGSSSDPEIDADISTGATPGSSKRGEVISTIGVPIEIGVDKNGKPKITTANTAGLSRAEKIELGMNIAAVAIMSGAGDRSKKPWVFTVKTDDWQLRAAITGQLEALGHQVKGPKEDTINEERSAYNRKYGLEMLGGYDRYGREVNHIKETVRRQCAKSSPNYAKEYNPDSPQFFNNPDNIAAGFAQRFFKGTKDGPTYDNGTPVLTQDKILRRIVAPAVFNPTADKARKRFENRLEQFGGTKYLNQGEKPTERIDEIAKKGLFIGNGWKYTLPDPEKIKTAKGANEELERIAKDLASSTKPEVREAAPSRPAGPASA